MKGYRYLEPTKAPKIYIANELEVAKLFQAFWRNLRIKTSEKKKISQKPFEANVERFKDYRLSCQSFHIESSKHIYLYVLPKLSSLRPVRSTSTYYSHVTFSSRVIFTIRPYFQPFFSHCCTLTSFPSAINW